MRSEPCRAARSSARSCDLKQLRPRQAEAQAAQALAAAALLVGDPAAVERRVDQRRDASWSSSTSNVRTVTGPRRHALEHAAVDLVLLVLVGDVARGRR